jgi:hypothetical protein
LYVQGLDSRGAWLDPTVCKLAPKDLLRAEVDAHAAFVRYIGESLPQRIGEPVYVDEIGGMVLELVGACWRMPELAHTQANLSNTFAEVCKYDSDHAEELAVPRTARSRPVFGEVRQVIDDVLLGQLAAVVRQSAHREPGVSLVDYYGLLPKIRKQLSREEDHSLHLAMRKVIPIIKPSTLIALRSLEAVLAEKGEEHVGPEGYPGPWFCIVHGDLHGGNILCRNGALWLVDFDDCRRAPAVQDLWMLLAGERHERVAQLDELAEGYEEFHDFPHRELALIEPLRTLRIMHHAGWIASRWEDPAFPRYFPWFNTPRYWSEHVLELREQLAALDEEPLRLQP